MIIICLIQGATVLKSLQLKESVTLSPYHVHTLGKLVVMMDLSSTYVLHSFNRIDLPPYTSYYDVKEKLKLAVDNTEGFEIE